MNNQNCSHAIAKNPLLILFLGACPAMAATATVRALWVWASLCWS